MAKRKQKQVVVAAKIFAPQAKEETVFEAVATSSTPKRWMVRGKHGSTVAIPPDAVDNKVFFLPENYPVEKKKRQPKKVDVLESGEG